MNACNSEWVPHHDYPELRSCDYCGSLHPQDLAKLVEAGEVTLGGADWKYGWPHKFYVSWTTPKPTVHRTWTYANGELGVVKEEPGTTTSCGKFYNKHLMEPEVDKVVLRTLSRASGIIWTKDGPGLYYQAPMKGYQAGFHELPDWWLKQVEEETQ